HEGVADQDVVARLAAEQVAAQAANEQTTSGAADQLVVPLAAVQEGDAAAALKPIVASAAIQLRRLVHTPRHFDIVVACLTVDDNAVNGRSERLPQLDVEVLLIELDLEAVVVPGQDPDLVVADAAADDQDALA